MFTLSEMYVWCVNSLDMFMGTSAGVFPLHTCARMHYVNKSRHMVQEAETIMPPGNRIFESI